MRQVVHWFTNSIKAFAPGLAIVLGVSAHAQIVVEGVSNRADYWVPVTFRVISETGYTYYSRLDGQGIDEDQWVTVERPMFHQIDVTRTNDASGAAQTNQIRFAILDPLRGESERGLYPWTTWPPVDSSSNECAGSRLRIVTPSNFPAGFNIPVVAITENSTGLWKRINGRVKFAGLTNVVHVKRGAGHAFLEARQTGAVISCGASLKPLATNKTIRVDAATSWTQVAGDITNDTTWSRDSRVHVATNISVAEGTTLTVDRGTVVWVDPRMNIAVFGTIMVRGTVDEPVVFTPASRSQPWGGLEFRGTATVSVIEGELSYRRQLGGQRRRRVQSDRRDRQLHDCDQHGHDRRGPVCQHEHDRPQQHHPVQLRRGELVQLHDRGGFVFLLLHDARSVRRRQHHERSAIRVGRLAPDLEFAVH